jgi:hypothetical protein
MQNKDAAAFKESQMMWNSREWREVTQQEIEIVLAAKRAPIFMCPIIAGNGAMDPSMWVITNVSSVESVTKMHENYRNGVNR